MFNNIKTKEDLLQERIFLVAQEVRDKRDNLLSSTDRYMLPDYPNKPEGVEVYRELLRNITNQRGFPFDIEWPTL